MPKLFQKIINEILLVIGLIVVIGTHGYLGYLYFFKDIVSLEGTQFLMHWVFNLVAGILILIHAVWDEFLKVRK